MLLAAALANLSGASHQLDIQKPAKPMRGTRITQATVFFIAQNTAALQPGRVKEGLREGRRILLVYSLGVVAVCIGLRGPLLRLFTTDPAAASYGCTMLAFESVKGGCVLRIKKTVDCTKPNTGIISRLDSLPAQEKPEWLPHQGRPAAPV